MSDSQRSEQDSTPAEGDDHDLALEEVLGEAAPNNDAEEVDALTKAQRAAAEAEQRVLRAQAELENVRKRLRREQQEERRYAAMPLARDLLPTIDNLERAMSAVTVEDCPPGLVDGVQMVASQIIDVLKQHQCERIDPVGQPFDPMQHEAVAQQPSDEHAEGTVMQVLQVGYILHDRVIRPAQVMVSMGPAASTEDSP